MSEELEVKTLDEISTYFIINEIGGFIWRMNHDMSHGRIPEEQHRAIDEDIVRLRKTQLEAVDCLTKFGVEKVYIDDKKTPSPEYWAWFRWWDSYIKGMSEEQWRELDKKLSSKQDISSYRPSGNWKDNIDK